MCSFVFQLFNGSRVKPRYGERWGFSGCVLSVSRTWVKLSLDTRPRPTRLRFPPQGSLERRAVQLCLRRAGKFVEIKSRSRWLIIAAISTNCGKRKSLHAFAVICRPKWQDQKKNPRKPYYDHYDPHFSEEQPEQLLDVVGIFSVFAKTPCMSSAKRNNFCQLHFKLFLICMPMVHAHFDCSSRCVFFGFALHNPDQRYDQHNVKGPCFIVPPHVMFEVLSYYRLFWHPTNSVLCPRLVMSHCFAVSGIDHRFTWTGGQLSCSKAQRGPKTVSPPSFVTKLARTALPGFWEHQKPVLARGLSRVRNGRLPSVTRSSHPSECRMLIRLCGRSQGASDCRRSHRMHMSMIGWAPGFPGVLKHASPAIGISVCGLSLWLPLRIFLKSNGEKNTKPLTLS